MKGLWRISIVVSCAVLGACAHDGASDRAAATSVADTRALVQSQCPSALRANRTFLAPGAIALSAILTPLIDKGADLLVEAVREAGKRQATAEVDTVATTHFYAATERAGEIALGHNTELGCLIVQSGTFWPNGSITDQIFHFEGMIVHSPGGQAFYIQPLKVVYDRNFGGSMWGDKRDLVLTVALSKPRGDQATGAFASTVLSFHGLVPKTALEGDALRDKPSWWMPSPSLTDAETALVRKAQAALDSRNAARKATGSSAEADAVRTAKADLDKVLWKKAQETDDLIAARLKHGDAERNLTVRVNHDIETDAAAKLAAFDSALKALGPVSVQVKITETRDGIAFMKHLGEVLGAAKPELTKLAKTELVPTERYAAEAAQKAARDAQQAAADAANIKAMEAQVQVEVAQAARDALPASASAAQIKQAEWALKIAKYNANVAYVKAGLPAPYPDATP